jgi:5-bromo-4-chloroindolyl phosphate hydrolysis protein
MLKDESPEEEKRETIEELSETLFLVQEMGRRLAHETHGSFYDSVQELNMRLHHARLQLNEIETSLTGD